VPLPADIKFLTLTVDVAKFISRERYRVRDLRAQPEEAIRVLREVKHAWNRLHSWLRKLWRRDHATDDGIRAKWENSGQTVPYFWVVEFTKNGWPHLHVALLWRPQIPWPDLQTIRTLWDKYGIGRNVDLENKNWKWQGPQQSPHRASTTKQWGSGQMATSFVDGHLESSCSSGRQVMKETRVEPGLSGSIVSICTVGATLRDIRYGVAYEFRGRPMLIEYVFDSVTQRKRPRYYHMGLNFEQRLQLGSSRRA
jgi:hypothetical protein